MNQPETMDGRPMAVVLAAGKGTRMKSDLPKVLCEACGRPLVAWVLDALRAAGIGRILVVIGYRGDLVRDSLRDYADLGFVEQTEQLGTGHAVLVCRDQLAGFEGPVVVVAGDSPMLQADSIRELVSAFQPGETACLLGTLIHDDPTGLGRIVRDAEGQFSAIVEDKDCTEEQRNIREVNMSTYLFDNRQMFSALEDVDTTNRQGEYYLTDVPGILLKRGLDVRALPVLRPCEALSVNTVEHLAIVEAEMRRRAAVSG
jgi:bifunctional UDP-N-acetylglucosamine pyrophosphorylase/glucosamine-1-phosphate N-acetyltransferase/UDP-N-acetylglucosamine pyrophosphorylase